MSETTKGIRSMLEVCQAIKPKQQALIIADTEGDSAVIGQLFMDAINSMGAEAVLTVINPLLITGHEPPASVAAAMKTVNVVFCVADKVGVTHTTARQEATAVGVRYYSTVQIPQEDLRKGISAKDMRVVKNRTEKLAQRLAAAKIAKITTPLGTNLTLNVSGRQAIIIHAMSSAVSTLPYYAEAAIAPVEGTAEGMLVVDLAFRAEWGYALRSPVRCTVKAGKVVDISGRSKAAGELRKIAATDENATNVAELGIGTSHIVPESLYGTMQTFARLGTAHIGIGRNSDIGGHTFSHIHLDGLMSQPTIELDDQCVLKNGVLQL